MKEGSGSAVELGVSRDPLGLYWSYIGIMEIKMETIILYRVISGQYVEVVHDLCTAKTYVRFC